MDRLSGADRYQTGVALSKARFPSTAPVVYIAAGANYPDALAAASAAIKQGGPLLLTKPNAFPAAVKAEIERLQPAKILVVGGKTVVTDAVLAELNKLSSNVMRLGGVDRFETSRKIVQYAFAGGTSSAYVVTGLDFADALSASATAGSKGVPVVLVNGGATTLNGETNASLQELGASPFTVLGGPSAISSGIESGLDGLGTVSRLAGTDRFETSVLVNKTVFGNPDHAYFASGAQFPDALAGSVFAGSLNAPLYIVPPTCVPQTALSDLTQFGTSKVALIGGTSSMSETVGEMQGCK